MFFNICSCKYLKKKMEENESEAQCEQKTKDNKDGV